MILSVFGFNLISERPESEAHQFVRSFTEATLGIRQLSFNQIAFLENLITSNNPTSNETLKKIVCLLTPQEMRKCFLARTQTDFMLLMILARHKRPLVKLFLQNPGFYLSLSELNSTNLVGRSLCSILLFSEELSQQELAAIRLANEFSVNI